MQAIRSYVRDVDPVQLRSEMGAGAADIAEVVSDVREQLPDLSAPPQLEPEQARFRLFDSITAFLKNAGQRKPLVLVLDDLQWADHPSLLLLEFVARELANSRVLVIGTYRDMEVSRQHPLSRTLGELTRERLFQRVLLRGLDQDDVGRFVELASGVTPPAGLVEAVHRQTEGNPLFVTEVVRLLVQEGALASSGQETVWNVRLPEGVREVIGRRLDRLSERCNETLTMASIIGREFTLEQLSPLIEDVTQDRLLEVLEEALASRVIEEMPSAVGRYQFTHALIQETLAGELSTTRKVRLHAHIAEALELLYGQDAEAHAAELARHFAEAQTVLGSGKLVHYSLLAGERALAAYAWEEARTHFEKGIAGVADLQTADETAALLYGLGRAQASMLQVEEAVANLRRAFDYFSQSGNTGQAVALACYPLPFMATQMEGAPQIVADALELVQPDSLQAALLLSRYGTLVHSQYGNYSEAVTAFTKALDIAKNENDTELELRTLTEAAFIDVYEANFDEALIKSLNALELASSLSDPHSKMIARYSAGLALIVIGNLDGALYHFEAGLPVAEKVRDRSWLARLNWGNARVHEEKGDWLAARSFSDRALEVWPSDPRAINTRAKIEYEAGDFAQGDHFVEKILESVRITPKGPNLEHSVAGMSLAIADRIKGTDEYSAAAKDAAETVLSFPSSTGIIRNFANVALGILAANHADQTLAVAQYPVLLPLSGTLDLAGLIGMDRLLGLLAQVMDKLDMANGHYEDALDFCRKGGYRTALAWTCCDYADTPLKRNAEGDRTKALSLLDESLAISSELGMRPLMERVLSRREILKA